MPLNIFLHFFHPLRFSFCRFILSVLNDRLKNCPAFWQQLMDRLDTKQTLFIIQWLIISFVFFICTDIKCRDQGSDQTIHAIAINPQLFKIFTLQAIQKSSAACHVNRGMTVFIRIHHLTIYIDSGRCTRTPEFQILHTLFQKMIRFFHLFIVTLTFSDHDTGRNMKRPAVKLFYRL